jgi:glycosyltransferase involved in cell wall biosynthesis
MRVATTSYYLPSESKIGVGHVAHRLANVLAARGNEVVMFSPCERPDDAVYAHRRVPMEGSLRTFRWALDIRRLPLGGFDVVHAHGDNHLLAGTQHPPVVRTVHGSCFSEAVHVSGAKEKLRMTALGVTEMLGAWQADTTVAISANTRHHYPWIRRVIPNGVDVERFRPGTKDPAPTILFVGTFMGRKRGRLLMDIFARQIRPAMPDARLWMVCSDAPDAPGVEVLGRLSDDELADRYRRAWVFCLPSSYEGFGVPYIEAMASGTPVVATQNPGAREVLSRGGGVLATEPQLGATLLRLLRDDADRAALARAGTAIAAEFAWSVVAHQYENVFRWVTERRR